MFSLVSLKKHLMNNSGLIASPFQYIRIYILID